MNKYKCCICLNEITNEDRIEALKILGILTQNFTCLSCASVNTKSLKAIWSGPTGSSNLILADSIGGYMNRDEDNPREPILNFEDNDQEITE